MSSNTPVHDPNGTMQKPPHLDKIDFTMWKRRMVHFFALHHDELWFVVQRGPHIPTKLVNDVEVPKDMGELTPEEFKKVMLDEKAQAIIEMACPTEVVRQCGNYMTAKELWGKLCEMFEGTPDVKANRVQLLIQQYEAFTSMPGEPLEKIYERFSCLLDELRAHKKGYDNVDILHKFIRALPTEWKLIKTVIRKKHDFESYTLSRLYGELRTHHLEEQQDGGKTGNIKDTKQYTPAPTALVTPNVDTEEPTYSDAYSFPLNTGLVGSECFQSCENDDVLNMEPEDLEEAELTAQLAFLSMRLQNFRKRTGRKAGHP